MEYIIDSQPKSSQAHFNSVDDFIEVAKNLHANDLEGIPHIKRHSDAMEHLTVEHANDDLEWFGGIDHKQTAYNFEQRECHSESVRKRIHDGAAPTMFNTTEFSQLDDLNIYHDEIGMMLDTNAYFNGEENCMVNFDVTATTRPIVWLACTMGGGASRGDDYFINRGIALIRTIHALELAGVSVGLVAYTASVSSGERAFITAVVKHPQNSLDETTLINVFATPSLFRHYGIFLLHIFISCSGCGRPAEPKKGEFDKSYAKGHKLVVIPQKGDFYCADEATRNIIKEVKDQAAITI